MGTLELTKEVRDVDPGHSRLHHDLPSSLVGQRFGA